MDNLITFQQLGIADEMTNPAVKKILDAVSPYSMVHETGIVFSMGAVVYAIKNKLPGAILECGTWRGGCSVAMLLIQRELFGKVVKPVYMLDSFEGLPSVDHRDGPLAAEWQAGADKEKFFDNCKAAQNDLESLLQLHNFSSADYKVVRGWFDNTIPVVASELSAQGLAVLRLDGDWYSSTDVALRYLCPITVEQGVVVVDDYYAWDGCARATHDYLSSNDLPYRIKSLPYNFGAYFIKRACRTSFNEF
ncbi:TylF/MycF/NovP-related O-methyltransferase [Pseudomonas protegens]|uniref:TylF/MycF/NovP-related O-methyltransferase n=1 Tax=Pseudomonas TaxID=286 RepID=UPI0032091434